MSLSSDLQDFLMRAGIAAVQHDEQILSELIWARITRHGELVARELPQHIRALMSIAPAVLEARMRNRVEPPLDVLLSRNLACLVALSKNDAQGAWAAYRDVAGAWAELYGNEWRTSLLPLAIVVRTLRVVACRAYRESGAQEEGQKHKRTAMDDAMELIRKFQQLVLSDRMAQSAETSRKRGALTVANEALRLFAYLRNTELANSLISQIDALWNAAGGLPKMETFPISQRVVYKFFYGRLTMLEGRIAQADESLSWAFTHCRAGAFRAKRLLLLHLVPVALVARGRVPSDALLAKYRLDHRYGPIIHAVRSGNVAEFDRQLESGMRWLVRRGVYLAFEAVRATVYKNFVRNVWRLRECTDAERTRVSLAVVESSLVSCGVPTERAELECILARLIHEKRIKGYLAHSAGYLVVSANDPFP